MSGNVINFPAREPTPPAAGTDPHSRMVQARRAFMSAYTDWLASNPTDADAAAETEGTVNAVVGLRDLFGPYRHG